MDLVSRSVGKCIWLFTLVSVALCARGEFEDEFYYGTFPEGFIWGTSSSAFQYEGAWNEDGKGPSIWDTFTHLPGKVLNNKTADVTCDTYHHDLQDIELMKPLGVSHFRFSISWPRLIPDPLTGKLNPAAIDYYSRLLDGLHAAGIEPIVTIYHWDLPQVLQDKYDGWTNPILVEFFEYYAEACFRLFGDRVKWWLTFNEPLSFLQDGLGTNSSAPGPNKPATLPYLASKVVLKAHARAWHLYDDKYRSFQNGKVGMCFATKWMTPKDPNNPADVQAAERAMQFFTGWFSHPVYGAGGDYPAVMREYVDRKSREQGLNVSRLPVFTPQEINYINGTYDYIGVNYYTTRLVQYVDTGITDPSVYNDQDSVLSVDPAWPSSHLAWLYVVPWGFRKTVNWVKDQYGDVPILITENGYADGTGEIEDDTRVKFYKDYINELLKASRVDGCNIVGYSTWALLDNFEWGFGYTAKFGIHNVNFTDPARTRTPKKSAGYLTQIIKNNGFPKPVGH